MFFLFTIFLILFIFFFHTFFSVFIHLAFPLFFITILLILIYCVLYILCELDLLLPTRLLLTVLAHDVTEPFLLTGLLAHNFTFFDALTITELVVLGLVLNNEALDLLLDAIDELHEALAEALLLHDLVEAATLAVVGGDAQLALQLGDLTVQVRFLELVGTEEGRTLRGDGRLGLGGLDGGLWFGALKRQVSMLGLGRHFGRALLANFLKL